MREFLNVKMIGIEEILFPLGALEIQKCKDCGKKMLSAYKDPIWCMNCEAKRDEEKVK